MDTLSACVGECLEQVAKYLSWKQYESPERRNQHTAQNGVKTQDTIIHVT
jgi:hypothetical protein